MVTLNGMMAIIFHYVIEIGTVWGQLHYSGLSLPTVLATQM